MGKTWSRRTKAPKKPRKPYRLAAGILLLAVLAVAPAVAASKPKDGDLALGAAIGSTDAYGGDWKGYGALSFEMWADAFHSYQASLSLTQDGLQPAVTSASAWHLPFARQAGVFASAGMAWPSGRGLSADAGAGFEFFPGRMAIQVRADYLYALEDQGDNGRGAAAVSGAARWKW